MLSHSAVLRLELTFQSLSPVLARYDPFGVDVPLNFDNTHTQLRRLQQLCPLGGGVGGWWWWWWNYNTLYINDNFTAFNIVRQEHMLIVYYYCEICQMLFENKVSISITPVGTAP